MGKFGQFETILCSLKGPSVRIRPDFVAHLQNFIQLSTACILYVTTKKLIRNFHFVYQNRSVSLKEVTVQTGWCTCATPVSSPQTSE